MFLHKTQQSDYTEYFLRVSLPQNKFLRKRQLSYGEAAQRNPS